MAREILGHEVQRTPDQPLSDVHGHVANGVIFELLDRWKAGMKVGDDAHIETVKLTLDGKVVGFRMYLVTGEPQALGPLRTEPLTEAELVRR